MELAQWFAIYRLIASYLYADRYKTRPSRRATPVALFVPSHQTPIPTLLPGLGPVALNKMLTVGPQGFRAHFSHARSKVRQGIRFTATVPTDSTPEARTQVDASLLPRRRIPVVLDQ